MGATEVVRTIGQGSVTASRVLFAHTVVPGLGIAAVAVTIASNDAIAYVVTVPLVPLLTVLVARSVAVGRTTLRDAVDRRGYLAASLFVLAASVLGLASQRMPGPAQLIAVAFVYLGWLRRDAVTSAVALAALLAVAPVDIKGPVSLGFTDTNGPQRVGALLLVAAVMIVVGLTRYGKHRRNVLTS